MRSVMEGCEEGGRGEGGKGQGGWVGAGACAVGALWTCDEELSLGGWRVSGLRMGVCRARLSSGSTVGTPSPAALRPPRTTVAHASFGATGRAAGVVSGLSVGIWRSVAAWGLVGSRGAALVGPRFAVPSAVLIPPQKRSWPATSSRCDFRLIREFKFLHR